MDHLSAAADWWVADITAAWNAGGGTLVYRAALLVFLTSTTWYATLIGRRAGLAIARRLNEHMTEQELRNNAADFPPGATPPGGPDGAPHLHEAATGDAYDDDTYDDAFAPIVYQRLTVTGPAAARRRLIAALADPHTGQMLSFRNHLPHAPAIDPDPDAPIPDEEQTLWWDLGPFNVTLEDAAATTEYWWHTYGSAAAEWLEAVALRYPELALTFWDYCEDNQQAGKTLAGGGHLSWWRVCGGCNSVFALEGYRAATLPPQPDPGAAAHAAPHATEGQTP